MTWTQYVPRGQQTRYTGLKVCPAQITLSITVARLMQQYGWDRVIVRFDANKKAILLQRTTEITEGFAVNWMGITARLSTVMPIGRYYLESENQEQMIFIAKNEQA